METVRLDALFVEQRPTRNTGAYTNHHNDSNKSVGSALARFERSSLPDHKSTRTVMLRFLKIVAPVKCVMVIFGSQSPGSWVWWFSVAYQIENDFICV